MAMHALHSEFLALSAGEVSAQLAKLDSAANPNDEWRGWRAFEKLSNQELAEGLKLARLYLLTRLPGLQAHGDLELKLSQEFIKGKASTLEYIDGWIRKNGGS